MNLIENRKKSESILEGRFIRHVLTENSKELNQAIENASSSFNSSFWSQRSFTITDNILEYKTPRVIRYIDIKTRTNKAGEKKRKKNYIVHNRLIYGQYNQIVKELRFGFTDAVKVQMQNIEDY